MKKLVKLTSITLVAMLIFALAACSGTKKENFREWFSGEFSPAFEAFAQTDYAKENLPMPNLSMIVGSVDKLDSILGFISDGKQPEGIEITENGNIFIENKDINDKKICLDIKSGQAFAIKAIK